MAKKIRPTVQVLIQKDESLLVYEGYDNETKKKFFRPVGGGLDFGETGAQAAIREFKEEAGVKVCKPKSLGFLENIFTYNGKKGHELVQIFICEFKDKKDYRRERFALTEGKRTLADARWVPIKKLLSPNTDFYPTGIKGIFALSRAQRKESKSKG